MAANPSPNDMTGELGWQPDIDEEPESWDDLVKALLSRGGPNRWYRGHRHFNWDLQATFERELLERDGPPVELLESMVCDPKVQSHVHRRETNLLHCFQDQAGAFGLPDLPPAWDRLAWWELMQHHRAPTRLLDWTTSPFVALWFALSNECDHPEDKCDHPEDRGGDMALWVLHKDMCDLNVRLETGDLLTGRDDQKVDRREWQNLLVDAAIEKAIPAPVPVFPRSTPRAVAQQSVLTVMANIPMPSGAARVLRKMFATRVRVREEWRSDIESACGSLGVNRLTLYRDLDTLGRSATDEWARRTLT